MCSEMSCDERKGIVFGTHNHVEWCNPMLNMLIT